ncbi:hypothetical protein BJ508DRAFT_413840 [Ascobolus immersus RN42]|uniref:Uncharacterized protein n=1 Tax=Ascobolus immersus RN42 TaxID=1160509 RepID=A0A3N4IFG0_ASCIM|nr:hypothetical protein BJ508DRAFT_413840 [Ascobolus immersus RN42]
MPAKPTPSPPQGIPRQPAPWDCRVSTLYLLPIKLPAGSLPTHTHTPSLKDDGSFAGGMGTLMILRYTHTPCGPYDELILIPGDFRITDGEGNERTRKRITRIFVSGKETTWNGRVEWNIPKELAHFSFTATSDGSERVEVSALTKDGVKGELFFKATIKPFAWTPALPFSSGYLPEALGMSAIAQPPLVPVLQLASGLLASVDGAAKGEEGIYTAGTGTWKETTISMKSNATKGCWATIEELSGGSQAGGWWPDGEGFRKVWPVGVGVFMKDADVRISEAIEWEDGGRS